MTDFNEIRPFNDNEVNTVLTDLANDPLFVKVVGYLYQTKEQVKQILQLMTTIQSVDEFQDKIIYPLIVKIEKSTTKNLSYSAMDQFQPEERHLFISNHRDIILDSAFLNGVMHQQGFRKTEIAIGDNLLIFDWIKKLARLNRTFIVKRNLGLREQLKASATLSAYIRHALTEKKESVWIAQREGRSKDGNDQTQPALLKMLNMSNKSSITEGFKELNIVPMAISYEIEPCAKSKVEELLNRKHNPDFSKTKQDDLNSMANGVMASKGHVHFGFGNPLNLKIDKITANKNNNEAIKAIVDYIDKRIYANYKLWPNNYIAADLLQKTDKHKNKYTDNDKNAFVERMNNDIENLAFDNEESSEMYLNMYATPVFNYEKHFGDA
ncbi:MAG: 1-acyl-sn-glycerol-3-phosphate acyltransferase [Prolixibacteraceae bacterium]|nr:1-acyl-sn-glycerol-3-phosphate acyltransferase [Prolixibacteraceae bacterium]